MITTPEPRPGRALLALLLAALAACTAPASPPGSSGDEPTGTDKLVRVRSAIDVERIEPGMTFHVAVIFQIAPHWHIYWVDSGDSGAPTDVLVKAPPGYTVGRPQFPRPESFQEPDGTTFGYQREAVLFVPVTAPAELSDGAITIDIETFAFVCRDVCLIAEHKVAIRAVTSATRRERAPEAAPRGADRDLIERFRRRLPQPLAALEGANATFDGDRLTITGPLLGTGTATLFPIQTPGIQIGAANVIVIGDRFQLTAPVEVKPHNALGAPMAIRVVLALGKRLDDRCYYWTLPWSPPDVKPPSAPGQGASG